MGNLQPTSSPDRARPWSRPAPIADAELALPPDAPATSTTTGPADTATSTVKPTTSTAPRPTTSTTIRPAGSPAPPVLQQGSIDRTARSITLTYDVPVKINPTNTMRGMLIMVFTRSSTCEWGTGPNGNGHEVLAGAGTPNITFAISGLKPGPIHITIVEGLVVSVDGGVANERVPCVAVPAGGPVGPTVGMATADAAHDQVEVRFDSDAAESDPSQLFFYGADSTCTILAGRGTKIEHLTTSPENVTVTVAGLVVGVNYMRIEPGLVTGEANLPNNPLPCWGVLGYDAPKLIATTPDLARSTISFTFDRPVGPPLLTAVSVATDPTYQDATQATRSVGTDGTATIVLEVANLRPGTLYIKIRDPFVYSRDGVTNLEQPWYPIEVRNA